MVSPVIDIYPERGDNDGVMSDEHAERIRRWMQAVISDGEVERLDALHIDVIDPRWKDRSTWVLSALSMFRLALQIRDELGIPS